MKKMIVMLMVIFTIGIMGCDNSTGGGGDDDPIPETITLSLSIKNNSDKTITSINILRFDGSFGGSTITDWWATWLPVDPIYLTLNPDQQYSLGTSNSISKNSVPNNTLSCLVVYSGGNSKKDFSFSSTKPNITLVYSNSGWTIE